MPDKRAYRTSEFWPQMIGALVRLGDYTGVSLQIPAPIAFSMVISLGPAVAANSLYGKHKKRTMRESIGQIGDSGLIR
jgi:hypothetical protein